ncbi:extracellular solute-binding protein [Streptomyces sp. AJS327]|uniref:extracellular solute-binding protein n=1 Tax=Streptomyces sp. AJS327 TaxID=2545265 RepID=UPI0015DD52E3|nr:extracellular solute-binding protein [Streptomyces sp. AJS327]MBA0053899.1 extracellular solute-binding protein [Streptomyces sp. AJS327]
MERRRLLRLGAAGAATGAAALATSACGAGSGSEKVTLRLVAADYGEPGGDNGSQGYWAQLVRGFEQRHPDIRVKVTVHSWNNVERKVAELVRAGKAPHLAQIGSFADYASQDHLHKVSELLSIPVQADFLPALAEAGRVRRVQYAIPFAASTRRLFYNRTLFERAGLDPDTPPRDWGELASAARALRSADVRIPYGLPLGPEEAPAETLMWMLSGGGGYTDTVGRYTIDSVENIRTFTWIRDTLVKPELTGTNPSHTDRQTLFNAFSAGEVGMLNGHPSLMRQADRAEVRYGTGRLPGRTGLTSGTLGVADWIIAFREPGHREEIGTFLDYVYREKRHYAFASQFNLLPVTTSASRRMRDAPRHRRLRGFLSQLSGAEFYPVGKVSWSKVSADIKDAIGEAVGGDSTPHTVLSGIQRRAVTADSPSR